MKKAQIISIAFQPLNDNLNDYKILTKWLNNQEVLKWWEGKPYTLEKTINKFKPRILKQTNIYPFFIIYNGQKIGYIQYYILSSEEKIILNLLPAIIIGIDIFIGNKKFYNQGIGTLSVKKFINLIKIQQKHVQKIIADPQVKNHSAIKMWEKCGFQNDRLLINHEKYKNQWKDCWLMIFNII